MDPSNLPDKSPCFVHSHLDKGASLQDWLHAKEREVLGTDVGVARSLQQPHRPRHHGDNTVATPVELPCSDGATHMLSGNDEDDPHSGSLTRQLAETAVGVREMSKQLGRARIRANIQSVLIVTKARDNRLIKLTRELALYLMLKPRHGRRGLVVYVDNQLRNSRRFDAAGIRHDHPEIFEPFIRRRSSSNNSLSSLSSSSASQDDSNVQQEGQLRYWTSDMCSRSPHLFDFVVTLGGDGTVLFTSWLFQRIVPPVLPFALGSLGFLTNFDFADHQPVVDSAIDAGIRVNLRMRFTCTVYRAVFGKGKSRKAVKKGETGEIMMKDLKKDGWEALEGGWSGGFIPDSGKCTKDREIMCFTTRPVETFEVLNDLVVDRGPSPYVSLLELFGDEHHMTTVQADGLCVATPTGSTAYSLSAGGSLVHPEIPAILISPICPHTLSFRPMLLPDSMELRICVPYNSRSTAWASFDGRGRVELKQGDHIKISASKYPFPTVCADKQSTDWFHSISRTLKWNERQRQKSFVVVEEGPTRKNSRRQSVSLTGNGPLLTEPLEEASEDEDEVTEDDDQFDIDDSSAEAALDDNDTILNLPHEQSSREFTLGTVKAREVASQTDGDLLSTPVLAALALAQGRTAKFPRSTNSRSRSRSGLRSGVDTPGRFAGPTHSPPHLADHPMSEFGSDTPSPTFSDSSGDSLSTMGLVQRGARDDLHLTQQYSSGRSRIPSDREFDDDLQTPTVSDSVPGRRGHHNRISSKDYDHQHRRAFAVWGNDETDSGASDSDI
ncbi:ATP-NAD kinase [Gyrodon lividus]|nr:ATP-NAD kinase [Gyrodon lividus]